MNQLNQNNKTEAGRSQNEIFWLKYSEVINTLENTLKVPEAFLEDRDNDLKRSQSIIDNLKSQKPLPADWPNSGQSAGRLHTFVRR